LQIADCKTSEEMARILSVTAKIGVLDRPILCGSKGMLAHLPKAFGVRQPHRSLRLIAVLMELFQFEKFD